MGSAAILFFMLSYNSTVKIYTRTGDAGDTSLFDGSRVKKDHARVDAYGEVDELNAWLGLVRASPLDAPLDEALQQIQRDLFAVGAQLADPADKLAPRVTKAVIAEHDVVRLEQLIDQSRRSSRCSSSPAVRRRVPCTRTVCRRAERRSSGSIRR
jgi:cob(I)alamin adenosyltransferase